MSKTKNKERKVVYLKDDRDYDSRGNVVRVPKESTEESCDILEPYDPAYLDEEGYTPEEISAEEKSYIRKVSILSNKLRKAKVKAEWLCEYDCFRVQRWLPGSEYPTYMYVAVEDGMYAFGGEKENLIESTRVSEVMDKVVRWVKRFENE